MEFEIEIWEEAQIGSCNSPGRATGTQCTGRPGNGRRYWGRCVSNGKPNRTWVPRYFDTWVLSFVPRYLYRVYLPRYFVGIYLGRCLHTRWASSLITHGLFQHYVTSQANQAHTASPLEVRGGNKRWDEVKPNMKRADGEVYTRSGPSIAHYNQNPDKNGSNVMSSKQHQIITRHGVHGPQFLITFYLV